MPLHSNAATVWNWLFFSIMYGFMKSFKMSGEENDKIYLFIYLFVLFQ